MGDVERRRKVQSGGDPGDRPLAKQIVELLPWTPDPVPRTEERRGHTHVFDLNARGNGSAIAQTPLNIGSVVPGGQHSDVVAGPG
jgi:hypothetical protein